MNVPTRDHTGCNYEDHVRVGKDFKELYYLKDALLDEFSAINDVPNDEDNVNEEKGDQSGVAKVLSVNVGVSVAQLQGCCGKENVVAIVTMSVTIKRDA